MAQVKVQLAGRRAVRGEERRRLRELLETAAREHGARGSITVVFMGDEEIRELHRRYLGDDTPTDTISFPLGSDDDPHDDGILGEVAVSVDTARRVAEHRGVSATSELALYALHGVLHVLGYDDADPPGRRRMRRVEARYLQRFGFRPRPRGRSRRKKTT